MKILLATDGSAYNNQAIKEFAGRLFAPDTELRIISAFMNSTIVMSTAAPMGGLAGYYEEIDNMAKKSAEDAVTSAADILQKMHPSLKITTSVINGSPKHVILKEAEAFGANLIVVGSHGLGAIERFLLGSVSQAVALHAKCSVEIVRHINIEKENK
ncbi:MAG: universal stress protein [Chitinophagaceae bacterium]